MKLYGLRTCDTCRKAEKALRAAGHDVLFVDIRVSPLREDEIARFHAALGPGLLNTRSTTWRGLDEAARAGDPVALIAAHPTLMKRPVIAQDNGTLSLGWGKDVQDRVLG